MPSSVARQPSARAALPYTWLLMSYQVPRTPAAPYMNVYRRLKSLKVLHVRPGLAALPARADAEEVLQAVALHINSIKGGSATLLRSDVVNEVDHLVAAYNDERNAEYDEIADACELITRSHPRGALTDVLAQRRRIARMAAQLQAVTERDAFGASHRSLAVEAIRELGSGRLHNGAHR